MRDLLYNLINHEEPIDLVGLLLEVAHALAAHGKQVGGHNAQCSRDCVKGVVCGFNFSLWPRLGPRP